MKIYVRFLFLVFFTFLGAKATSSPSIEQGYKHVLVYPVSTTQLLIPEQALRKALKSNHLDPQIELSLPLEKERTLQALFDWIGLARFDSKMTRPEGVKSDFGVGAAVIRGKYGNAISISCAACHASNFFGRTIMGLPNKGVRANELFVLAKRVTESVSPEAFQLVTGASDEETEIYATGREALRSVAADKPLILGLDTSLAHVGRSLARRKDDPWASKSELSIRLPRRHHLDFSRADSKPAVWWNVKYKSRYLSDGSIVSGHPITTNILWNEIGRGADLIELDQWINDNQDTLDDILAYINTTEPPYWEDFFGKKSINIEYAKAGEKLFAQNCSKCHGTYKKDWDDGPKTISLDYPYPTKVKDVGTDPSRYLGMKDLVLQLNSLEISKRHGVVAELQKGYVPPPLLGIWARYPYFHNNSVPNLCALTSPNDRPKVFWVGPAENLNTDFDSNCVGYPTGKLTPESWSKKLELRYDTKKSGMSNQGHTKMFLNADGSDKFTPKEKIDLIEYLKTL